MTIPRDPELLAAVASSLEAAQRELMAGDHQLAADILRDAAAVEVHPDVTNCAERAVANLTSDYLSAEMRRDIALACVQSGLRRLHLLSEPLSLPPEPTCAVAPTKKPTRRGRRRRLTTGEGQATAQTAA